MKYNEEDWSKIHQWLMGFGVEPGFVPGEIPPSHIREHWERQLPGVAYFALDLLEQLYQIRIKYEVKRKTLDRQGFMMIAIVLIFWLCLAGMQIWRMTQSPHTMPAAEKTITKPVGEMVTNPTSSGKIR